MLPAAPPSPLRRGLERAPVLFLPAVVTGAGLCSGTLALAASGSFQMGVLATVLTSATVAMAAVLLRP
ncbi:hypothetical protein G6038_06570 [Rhodococcus sp. 14C212]|uniref:hypothetical protein n=1 Tax=Rhodococcus sp. 14C212 TaxID=2711209 RepID=UPI0013EBAECB|nr:hypothetical protein [Rhodococcus sp. 14C212]NGP05151.1 hypothetical protein [Rhodococcus sp. 14C212]